MASAMGPVGAPPALGASEFQKKLWFQTAVRVRRVDWRRSKCQSVSSEHGRKGAVPLPHSHTDACTLPHARMTPRALLRTLRGVVEEPACGGLEHDVVQLLALPLRAGHHAVELGYIPRVVLQWVGRWVGCD